MSNISIRSINRTLSSPTTPGQSGPGSDGNEGVLRIIQSSSTTVASPSDCLMLHPGHLFVCVQGGGSYLSAEMQSVYSTALPANWASKMILSYINTLTLKTQRYCYSSTFL